MAHIVRAKTIRRFKPICPKSIAKSDPPGADKKMKSWLHLDLAVLTGFTALISSISGLAGVIIALRTLSNEQEKQRSQQIQNMIEWTDSS